MLQTIITKGACLLPEQCDIMTLLGPTIMIVNFLANCVIGWYGFMRFWPDLKRQKRTENLIGTAKMGLEIVMDIEEKIIQLHVTHQIVSTSKANHDHTADELQLLFRFNRLRNVLLLLKNEVNVTDPAILTQVTWWLKKIDTFVIPHQKEFNVSAETLNKMGFLQSGTWRSEDFEQLKITLLKLQEIRETKKPTWRLTPSTFLTVAICFFYIIGGIATLIGLAWALTYILVTIRTVLS